jgi:hypothetical protein
MMYDMEQNPGKKEKLGRMRDMFRSRLGKTAVTAPVPAGLRPPVESYDTFRESFLDYATRNAAQAGIDLTSPNDGFVRWVRKLDNWFGGYIDGYRPPDPNQHGFSTVRPYTVFRWNLDDTSKSIAEDLLYVSGAVPDGEPETYDNEGTTVTTQKYTSTTGLRFIDTRHIHSSDEALSDDHSLYVYFLPPEEAATDV